MRPKRPKQSCAVCSCNCDPLMTTIKIHDTAVHSVMLFSPNKTNYCSDSEFKFPSLLNFFPLPLIFFFPPFFPPFAPPRRELYAPASALIRDCTSPNFGTIGKFGMSHDKLERTRDFWNTFGTHLERVRAHMRKRSIELMHG